MARPKLPSLGALGEKASSRSLSYPELLNPVTRTPEPLVPQQELSDMAKVESRSPANSATPPTTGLSRYELLLARIEAKASHIQISAGPPAQDGPSL